MSYGGGGFGEGVRLAGEGRAGGLSPFRVQPRAGAARAPGRTLPGEAVWGRGGEGVSVGHGGLGAFAKTAFLFQPNQRVCWLPLLSGFSSCVERARFGEHCWAGSENSSWILGPKNRWAAPWQSCRGRRAGGRGGMVPDTSP